MLDTPAVPFELQHVLEPYRHWHEDDNSHPPVKIALKTKLAVYTGVHVYNSSSSSTSDSMELLVELKLQYALYGFYSSSKT